MGDVVYTSTPPLVSPMPAVSWPDPILIARAWLLANLTDVNVVTTTDTTFGTDSPAPSTDPVAHNGMACPLVLLEPVPAGRVDEDDGWSETTLLDVSVFAYGHAVRPTWSAARTLSRQVHALMVQLAGVRTAYGTADEVHVTSAPGALPYSNPNLVRFLASYEITSRPA